jgi:hypothetical protein
MGIGHYNDASGVTLYAEPFDGMSCAAIEDPDLCRFAWDDFKSDVLSCLSDGIPAIVKSLYVCDCGAEWYSHWSCACDDECGSCGASVGAEEHEILAPAS